MVDEIFSHDPDTVMKVMTDKYGNYVIQKAIESARGELRQELVLKIRVHEARLKEFVCGKHILTCVEKVARNGN